MSAHRQSFLGRSVEQNRAVETQAMAQRERAVPLVKGRAIAILNEFGGRS